ncbi:MAG: autotransporter domain-containing protein [Opitutales bacterium]|nr:autotransporter domain-containing protein [Opitutales bacterium]
MKFTKQALFTASLLLGATLLATARETETLSGGTVNMDDLVSGASNTNFSRNYVIEEGSSVVFNVEQSVTLLGRLLGSSTQTPGTNLLVGSFAPLNNTSLTIQGGGTFEYKGFHDIGYYDAIPYMIPDSLSGIGRSNAFNYYASSLIVPDETTGWTDPSVTAYSGSLTISGDTIVKVSGYLTQYVEYPPNEGSAWVGVQDLTLTDTSTISFASSRKNLLDDVDDFNLASSKRDQKTNSLNFLKNVKASAESTIEMGIDRNSLTLDGSRQYSSMRLIVQTDAGETSTIGHLSGTGRVYFVGTYNNTAADASQVYFTSQAQFLTGTTAGLTSTYTGDDSGPTTFDREEWLSYIKSITGKYDTTGETMTTGAMADVFLSGGHFYIGYNPDTGTVVNNIFASASSLQTGIRIRNANHEEVDESEYIPNFVPNNWANDGVALYVYGTQIVNNFQSFCSFEGERIGLFDEVAVGNNLNQIVGHSEVYSSVFAAAPRVQLESNAVLVINQDKYRDGVFSGVFLGDPTTQDGVVIKAGEGNFVHYFLNDNSAFGTDDIAIERLIVLEGMWLTSPTALSTTSVSIGKGAIFNLLQNDHAFLRGTIKAATGSELRLSRDTLYATEDDEGNAIQASYIETGHVDENGKKVAEGLFITINNGTMFRRDNVFETTNHGANGVVEVLNAQDEFYGTVTVGRGMTLSLGSDQSENYSSAFINAEKIVLCGEENFTDDNTINSSALIIGSAGTSSATFHPSYVQVLSLYYKDENGNILPGVGAYDEVRINSYATLAWNIKASEAASFDGISFSAGGAFVKMNLGTLSVKDALGYVGATSILNGALTLEAANVINHSSGLILAGGASVLNNVRRGQVVNALVGGEGTTLTMQGAALTVGWSAVDTTVDSPVANYFLATYNGDDKYLNGGLNLLSGVALNTDQEDAIEALFGDLGSERPDFNGAPITVADTVGYIADPALLKTSLARSHAVIDSATWATIAGTIGTDLSLFDYFRDTFSVANIRAFVDSSPSGWTPRQCEILLEFAKSLEASDRYLFEKEGSSYNLTAAGFAILKDSYAMKYWAGQVLGNAALADLSLYNFISNYDANYSFRFTASNVSALYSQYGITASDDASFAAAIGVSVDLTEDYGPAFAGTIDGDGTRLIKRGAETLTLTGINQYSGSTTVQRGELRVDYDAIPRTTAIRVESGAVLTIVSEALYDSAGTPVAAEFNPDDGSAILSGAGTLLKDGAGTLEIVSALATEPASVADDFTGAIIVGKDTLQIDITTRESLASDIYINTDAVLRFSLGKDAATDSFALAGGIYGNGTIVVEGTGSLVFADGDALASSDNSTVVFRTDGDTALKFVLDGYAGTESIQDFREDANFVVADGSSLEFNISSRNGLEYVYGGTINAGASAAPAGTLRVSGTTYASEAFGTGRKLKLSGSGINLDEIDVTDQAILTLAASGTAKANTVVVGSSAVEAKLVVAGTLDVAKLTVESKGLLENTGTITAGTLTLNNATTLTTGTLKVANALEVNADSTLTGTLDLSDAAVTVADNVNLALSSATLTTNTGTVFTLGEAATMRVTGTTLTDVLEKLSTSAASSTLIIDGGSVAYDSSAIFSGSISLVNGATMNVDSSISGITAVSGDGTISVCRSTTSPANLTVNVDSDVVFTGTIAFNVDPDIDVTGSAVWSIDGASFTAVGTINVHAGAGVGVGMTPVSGTTITLFNNAVIALVPAYTGTATAQTFAVTSSESVDDLTLRVNGTLDFATTTPEAIFNLATDTYGITLSNFDGDLTLRNLDSLGANVDLETYGVNGALILEGGTTDSVAHDGSIGGNGNLTIKNKVDLAATSHSFAGTLTVVAAATANFNNATLATTRVDVESGATLAGGITLGSSGVVTFNGAKYTATLDEGNQIVAGTIAGTVDVTVVADDAARGVPYTLFVADDLTGLTVGSVATSGDQPVMIASTSNQVLVYVAQDNLSGVAGANYHDGLGSFLGALSALARPDSTGAVSSVLGRHLNMISAGQLSNETELLSPLSYASLVSMPAAGFASDQRSVSQRLEQRLYDNVSLNAIWDYAADWEFFAQAQGSSVTAGTNSNSMTYDFNTFGVFAGMDRKFSHEFASGFAIAYDSGKARIHHSGGRIDGGQLRAVGFAGKMLTNSLALNSGVTVGFASYDIRRQNGLATCKDDTNVFNAGVFADLVAALPLSEFVDGERIDLMPHIGLALGYYNVGGSNESGAVGALDVDRFSALSLQAKVGAELAAIFSIAEYNARATLDVSLIHEFLDDEVEIDASIEGRPFSVDARALSKTLLSIAPGCTLDLDSKTSVYMNYEFRAGTESVMSHSANIGFRHRF